MTIENQIVTKAIFEASPVSAKWVGEKKRGSAFRHCLFGYII